MDATAAKRSVCEEIKESKNGSRLGSASMRSSISFLIVVQSSLSIMSDYRLDYDALFI
jgi:hypothetical protein